MSRRFNVQIESDVPNGTAPMIVDSSTLVTNFNADLLDGQHGSYYQNADNLNNGTILAARMPALTGDITTTVGTVNTTLANTTVTAASYGSASAVSTFTVDAKGRLTAASNAAISIAQSAVTNLTSDLALKAPLASPALTGTPTSPTAAVDTNTTQIATTAFVIGQGYLKSSSASSTYAPIASPTFTGIPSAPTAAVDTNTTQIATTEFVLAQASGSNPLALGSVNQGTSTRYARQDHVHPTTGLGLTSGTLAQFASTTSSQLAGVISDETGSGSLVFATSPTFAGTIGIPGTGTNQIKAGTGDGASFTTYNMRIRSWWGIGFTDYQDLNTATVYIDTRSGLVGASGTPTLSEHLTTKSYVDSVSGGLNSFFLSGM